MASCIVIGAGMAGLTAARELTQNGWEVVVLDKGRGVGGRMATRRVENARADHGAQYFSARTPDFKQLVAQLKEAGVVSEWQLGNSTPADGDVPPNPRFVGTDGMSAVAKHLARNLAVKTAQRAVSVAQTTLGCSVTTDTGHVYQADALVVTAPAPQIITLLADSAIELNATEFAALRSIVYLPCIAVVALTDQATKIPKPGNIKFEQGAVAWLADNQQKGISPLQTSVTIHASAVFSSQNLEADLDGVGQYLIDQVSEWVAPASVAQFQVHRWRYSLAEKRHPQPFITASAPFKLLLGGDGFGAGNVEGAFQSGLQMAQYLINTQ